MRTTVTLDDALVADAKEYTGIEETSALLRHALTKLVQYEAGQRLIALGGSDPDAWAAPRRKPVPAPGYGFAEGADAPGFQGLPGPSGPDDA